MICPVCHGSGITTVSLLDKIHTLGVRCGGCDGTGVLKDDDEPDTRPLRDKLIAKKVKLMAEISELRNLPSNLERRWNDRLDGISLTQADAEAVLRDLQKEVDDLELDLPDCDTSLIYSRLGELSRMCAEYRRNSTS